MEMCGTKLPQIMATIAASGVVTPSDVVALRREVYCDDKVSRTEAEALLSLDHNVKQACPEWTEYFTQAMVQHIVHQSTPEGSVSEENAQWLIDNISKDGLVDTAGRLQMLIKVIEDAQTSPDSIQKFALSQVFKAIVYEKGVLTDSRVEKQQVISSSDVELIRRLLFAFRSDGGLAVTKCEAEFLFDLNDATLNNENDPSWSDLFVKAVGNYLMATLGNGVPVRTVSLEKTSEWTFDASLSSMVGLLKSAVDAMQSPLEAAEAAVHNRNEGIENAYDEASEITLVEAKWVIDRINRDGIIHDNEKALLQFLKEESVRLHPEMDAMLKAVS